jgi:diguanylate cyclase (GGDEF)-like protein
MPASKSTHPDRNRPKISIRARIMILALMLIVPLMTERVVVLGNARSERIGHTIEQVASLSQRGSEAQSEIVNATRAMLQVVARAYPSIGPTPESCAAFLSGFATDVPWLAGLSIVGANDRIFCATRASSVGLDVSDRDYLGAARQSGGFVLSGYLVERVNNHPAVIAAYPAAGKAGAVVILASIDLQWVERFAQIIDGRPGTTAFLLGADGAVLSELPGRGVPDGGSAPDFPLIRAAIAQAKGALVAPGLDGIRRIYGFSALPGTDTRIVVGVDEREALGGIDREISLAYLQLAVFGALAMLLTWFVSERFIIAPIRALSRTATSIGRGDMETRPARGRWTPEFAPLAAALADMAAKLAERDRDLRAANHHLQELALLDGLSGLPNRRSFDIRLASIWLAADPGTPMSLLMMDVDHFKLFNDTQGHPEGDGCLRMISKTIGAVAREGDFAARYGGEEFIMLLAGIDADEALKVAERSRAAVEALGIAHPAAPRGIVTISVGVATLTAGEVGGEQALIEAADAALYDAKRGGRNVIASHAPARLARAS